MIYYQISGFEWIQGYETYLPDNEGFTYFFYLSFKKEQPLEKLKLIFIDLINAEYDKIGTVSSIVQSEASIARTYSNVATRS